MAINFKSNSYAHQNCKEARVSVSSRLVLRPKVFSVFGGKGSRFGVKFRASVALEIQAVRSTVVSIYSKL